jgi:hypothetical protein
MNKSTSTSFIEYLNKINTPHSHSLKKDWDFYVDIEDPNNIVLLNFTRGMRQFNGNRKKSRILASINEHILTSFQSLSNDYDYQNINEISESIFDMAHTNYNDNNDNNNNNNDDKNNNNDDKNNNKGILTNSINVVKNNIYYIGTMALYGLGIVCLIY